MERGILFSGPMVRAILEGRKTQTRRVVKPDLYMQPEDRFLDVLNIAIHDALLSACPHGQPGDLLYARETHFRWGKWITDGLTKTGKQRWRFRSYTQKDWVHYPDDPPVIAKRREDMGWHKRPSLFMPKWAARIWLEILSVKVERIQKIQGAHVIEEGIKVLPGSTWESRPDNLNEYARRMFRDLWDSLNKKRGFGWDVNPWVWVIEFRRIKP